jgi:hypothetical protein
MSTKAKKAKKIKVSESLVNTMHKTANALVGNPSLKIISHYNGFYTIEYEGCNPSVVSKSELQAIFDKYVISE